MGALKINGWRRVRTAWGMVRRSPLSRGNEEEGRDQVGMSCYMALRLDAALLLSLRLMSRAAGAGLDSPGMPEPVECRSRENIRL